MVGFEADPDLVAYCKKRFSNEIASGKVIIIEGAIVDSAAGKNRKRTVKFYKNLDNSVWGTIKSDWAERNKELGTRNKIINVKAVNFATCLMKYGIPYYLKIDIEGVDVACLKTLLQFTNKPSYISIESEKIEFKKLLQEFVLLEKF